MDFDFSPEEKAFRAEAAVYIRANLKEGVVNEGHVGTHYTDTPARRGFMKALARKGLLGLSWPKEYGGKGMPFIYDYHLLEELCLALAPTTGKGIGIIGQTLIRHGTEFQKKLLLPKILSGEIEWAIGYSEPEAGSDLAALKLKATRDANGHGWRLNGQKRFNTSAHYGDWYWLAARTDPNAPKHKGITLFMLDIAEARANGMTVNAMHCIDGDRTNEVFFDNVYVDDKFVMGELNKGFYYISEALDFERHTLFPYGMLERVFKMFVDYVRTATRDGVPMRQDPAVRRTVADLATDLEAARMHSLRVVNAMQHGRSPNVEAAMNKIWATEWYQRFSTAAVELMGPGGWLHQGSKYAQCGATFVIMLLASVQQTTGGGSSEVQRNIIARRGLGLPNPA